MTSVPTPTHPLGIPAPGEIVAGKYQVERIMAAGGMGVVLAARHIHLDQPIALKVLMPRLVEDSTLSVRFLREARAAAALQSEHVVRVFDVGSLENRAPYIGMEYLHGADLSRLIGTQGPLPIPEAVDYILQACSALAEAHKKGIVHRDIKPSNLFLTTRPDGSPLIKVVDFGIAKFMELGAETNAKLTSTGTGMGSPQYMAPEQIRDAQSVDVRADIWAIGVTLHELLTGEPPFSASNFHALYARILSDQPVRLRARLPSAPAELEAIVLRCLEKEPKDRFGSIARLTEALLPFVAAKGTDTEKIAVAAQRLTPLTPLTPVGPDEETLPAPRKPRAEAVSTDLITTISQDKIQRRIPPHRRAILVLGGLFIAGASIGFIVQAVSPAPATAEGSPPAPRETAITASQAPTDGTGTTSPLETAPSPSATHSPMPPPAASSASSPPKKPSHEQPRSTSVAPVARTVKAQEPTKGIRLRDPLDDRK